MEDNRINRPVHKKRKLRWGRLVFLLILLSAFFTAAFWGSVWVYDNLINPPQAKIIGADEKIVSDEKLNERINILLLGIDDGDSEAAATEPKRTDAILLASFDPATNQAAMTVFSYHF